jgi:hypothetical protein
VFHAEYLYWLIWVFIYLSHVAIQFILSQMEILPPEGKDISPSIPKNMPLAALWRNSNRLQKAFVILLSVGTVASVAMFAVGQFFQTRGVQSVLTSRVFLVIAVIFPAAWFWQMAFLTKSKRWKCVAAILTMLLAVGAFVLDRAFPMPSLTSNATNPPLLPPKKNVDGFPFIVGAPLGDNDSRMWEMIVRPFGVLQSKSYSCDLMFHDLIKQRQKESWLKQRANSKHLPELIKETGVKITMPFYTPENFKWSSIDPNKQHYHVEITCPNGAYDEDWEIKRIQGQLRTKITIDKVSPWEGQKPESIYSCIDPVSARPGEPIEFVPQDRYPKVNTNWKPNHAYEFPVAIIANENDPNSHVFIMHAEHPGCWVCLQDNCQ